MERFPARVTEHKVNWLLDCIPVIFDWSWLSIMTLREYLLVIFSLGFQEFYVKSVVNVPQVRVTAKVEGVVIALVVNLYDCEGSQPSGFHLLVDIW